MNMFQRSQLVHGDDVPIARSSIRDLDVDYFRRFLRSRFQMELEDQLLSVSEVLTNMRLLSDGQLTVAGALLFAKEPNALTPAFRVRGVSYPGTDIHVSEYADAIDSDGRIQTQFEETVAFIMRNLRREQRGDHVNSLGTVEVPRIAIEELVANALIHREHFISAPVRVFIFDDRIEIISPGHLPNNLTVANIRLGNSNIRNPILTSYATKLLPYRGLGNGIPRALQEYPHIEFQDDRDGNQFTVTVKRPTRQA